MFDYLYVKDLVKITNWFIENDARDRAYNVCSGRPVALTELARLISQVSAEVSGSKSSPNVSVLNEGMGSEYSADNSRMLTEMGGYQFWDLQDSICDLYAWYQQQDGIDIESLRFDELSFDEKGRIGVSK
jgi:nucleoside-diphosphate-sugar epimerase